MDPNPYHFKVRRNDLKLRRVRPTILTYTRTHGFFIILYYLKAQPLSRAGANFFKKIKNLFHPIFNLKIQTYINSNMEFRNAVINFSLMAKFYIMLHLKNISLVKGHFNLIYS